MLFVLFPGALSAVPLLAPEGKTAGVPVDRTAYRADVHFFVRFHFSPAELTVGDERLVLVNFLRRKVAEVNGPSPIVDEHYFFPAARTRRVVSPPANETSHAKGMAAFETAEFLFCVGETDGAFFSHAFRHFVHHFHASGYARIDESLRLLGRSLYEARLLALLSCAAFGLTAGVPFKQPQVLRVFAPHWLLSSVKCLQCLLKSVAKYQNHMYSKYSKYLNDIPLNALCFLIDLTQV